MRPQDCPRFDRCSAPICVLDPAWRKAVMLQGERVCHYLTISGKPGAAEYMAGQPDNAVYNAVLAHKAEACQRHPLIAKRIRQAAGTGFRGQNLRRETASDALAGGHDLEGDGKTTDSRLR